MPPDGQSHDLVRLIRQSSQMFVAPIPFDAKRNLFVLLHFNEFMLLVHHMGSLLPKVLLELRHQAEGKYRSLYCTADSLFIYACLSSKQGVRIAVSLKQLVIPASCLSCCRTCHRTLPRGLSHLHHLSSDHLLPHCVLPQPILDWIKKPCEIHGGVADTLNLHLVMSPR